MPLLPLFSFTFSLFILWNIGFDLLHKYCHFKGPQDTNDDLFADLEPTRREELVSLIPSAIINLGWMGYVQYITPSLLSGILFDIAPLLFGAEAILLILPEQSPDQPPVACINFISCGLFFLQAYFSVVYLTHCIQTLGNLLF